MFIVGNKKVLQAHADGAILGQSATQKFTYEVMLWKTPLMVTTNNWDFSDMSSSDVEWLNSNCVAVHIDEPVYQTTPRRRRWGPRAALAIANGPSVTNPWVSEAAGGGGHPVIPPLPTHASGTTAEPERALTPPPQGAPAAGRRVWTPTTQTSARPILPERDEPRGQTRHWSAGGVRPSPQHKRPRGQA